MSPVLISTSHSLTKLLFNLSTHNMGEAKRISRDIKRETLCLIIGSVLAMFGTICVLITMFAPWGKKDVRSCQIPFVTYDGLWFYCVWTAANRFNCAHNLRPSLPLPISWTDLYRSTAFLQASRVLTCVSLVCVLSAWVPLVLGLRRFLQRGQRSIPLIAAGCMLLTAAITVLIPVTLIAVHLEDFFPEILGHTLSLGLGLYAGWVGSGLLMAAGVILLTSTRPCIRSGEQSGTEEACPCVTSNSSEENDSEELTKVWIG